MASIAVKVFWKVVHLCFKVILFFSESLLRLTQKGGAKRVPPVKNPILLKSATRLALDIREGKLRSKDIVSAYIERISEVDPYINATVERRFEAALREAEEVDTFVASGVMNRVKMAKEKPLLGVPVTIKQLLTVKGLHSTAGSVLFKDIRAGEDAPTVAAMKEAGAIIIATTSTPEMGLNFETRNLLNGKTCNPYDTSKTPGGSSGGESALISAAGSVIGLGNDMAGSVRVPSLFTGIFSHKPTRGLVSNGGCFPVLDPKMEQYVYTGPMCRYAEDLIITMATLAAYNGNKNIKFGQTVNFKKVKIYYMLAMHGPLVADVDPEITAAVQKAITYLETAYCIQATEVKIASLQYAFWMLIHSLLFAVPDLKGMLTLGKGNVKPFLELLKLPFGRSKLSATPLVAMVARHIPFLCSPSNEIFYRKLCNKFRTNLNNILNDDNSILLIPTFPKTAPSHYGMGLLLPSVGYTCLFNLLSNPATHCTMGLSKKGMPIGFQIVGRENNDALTVACAVELEKAFGGWVPPMSH